MKVQHILFIDEKDKITEFNQDIKKDGANVFLKKLIG
jgi:hypothetical protein